MGVGVAMAMGMVARILPGKLPEFSLTWRITIKVLPLSVVFFGMITFNNLSLKYLGVAFYTVGRSLTTVFNVVLTYLILKKKTSFRALLCCTVIMLGFLLGVNQEGNSGHLSYTGVLCGVMASLFVALFAVYNKQALSIVDRNPWKLNYYNYMNSVALYLPFIAWFGEAGKVTSYPNLTSSFFWLMMTISGIIGTILGYFTGLQIKVTSPLTHNVSGTAKACFQTVLAVLFNGERKTYLWWMSNFMVLVGSAAYTMVRHSEMREEIERNSKEKELDVQEDDNPGKIKAEHL